MVCCHYNTPVFVFLFHDVLTFYDALLELRSRRCLCYPVFPVKTEKKTVQFSEDIQVETIEPEPEPVYIDEVRVLVNKMHGP